VIENARGPEWVISGSADHVCGLARVWQVPVNKRTSDMRRIPRPACPVARALEVHTPAPREVTRLPIHTAPWFASTHSGDAAPPETGCQSGEGVNEGTSDCRNPCTRPLNQRSIVPRPASVLSSKWLTRERVIGGRESLANV
jgi:hypothetical protein